MFLLLLPIWTLTVYHFSLINVLLLFLLAGIEHLSCIFQDFFKFENVWFLYLFKLLILFGGVIISVLVSSVGDLGYEHL
jgi:hypothetical protein